jgi:hypothetical protein
MLARPSFFGICTPIHSSDDKKSSIGIPEPVDLTHKNALMVASALTTLSERTPRRTTSGSLRSTKHSLGAGIEDACALGSMRRG